jgi:hypothetical protein
LYNERGHAEYKLVDFPAAVNSFTEAISNQPEFDAAYYNRATVRYRMGKC